MIIADTKSNLCKNLSHNLIKRGYEVFTVDFVNPEKSCSYNPLDYVRYNAKLEKYNEQDILSIAYTLAPNSAFDDAFWTSSARTVIACFISYVLEAFDDCDKNLTSVLEVFRAVSCSDCVSKGYISFLEKWKIRHPDSFSVKKYEMFKSVLTCDKTWGCIVQFVSMALDLFDFDEAREMFSGKNAVNIKDLGKKKCALFLNISDTDRTLDKLVNIFYTQTFQTLCEEADNNDKGRLNVPVRIFLDDFATNTYIPNFEKLISVIRSREISVSIILQSLTQLETIYTKSQAITIVNNCDHLIYLGSNDLETAEYIATRVCKSPENILCMPTDEIYLLCRGKKGECLEKIAPYSTQIVQEQNVLYSNPGINHEMHL